MTDETESLKARLTDVAAEALEREMSDISEEHYAAGWMGGLEYELWSMLRGGPRNYGMGTVEPERIEKLRQLSDDCCGWCTFERFVPIAEWRREYARWFKDELIPILRKNIEFIRSQVGKTDFLERVTTEAHVMAAERRLADALAELPKVITDAG